MASSLESYNPYLTASDSSDIKTFRKLKKKNNLMFFTVYITGRHSPHPEPRKSSPCPSITFV